MSKIMLISPKDNNFYNFRSELILKLHEMGNDIMLVCPYGSKIDFFIKRGCQFIDLTIDRRGTNVFNDFKLMSAYYKLIKQVKPDIVLTYTTKPSVYAGFVCGLLKVPYIINNAGLMEAKGLFGKFMNFLYKMGFRKASCIMFQNSYEKEKIVKLLKNKVHYRRIPGSGVNLKDFVYKNYPDKDSAIMFNYVARIVKNKGIDEFLECAERIKEEYPNTRFVLYGDYDDNSYKDRVSELVKQGIVEYGGVQLNMKPYIESAHAVIHPSYYEGMTNVVLEHSAMGRPCLGSDVPGVSDGIEDGNTGYIFEVRNVDSLVNAVKKFIELPYEKKVQMGIAARRKMENEFNRETVTQTYIEAIERSIKNG